MRGKFTAEQNARISDALASVHNITFRSRIIFGAFTAQESYDVVDTTILGGSLTFDATAEVYSSGTVQFGVDVNERWPEPPPFSPWGGQVQIWVGVRFPNGELLEASLGKFVIWSLTEVSPGIVEAELSDRSSLIRSNTLQTPFVAARGWDPLVAGASLIQTSYPTAGYHMNNQPPYSAPPLETDIVYMDSRISAIHDLLFRGNKWMKPDQDGLFSIQPRFSPGQNPLHQWDEKDTTVRVRRRWTRDGVRNVVVARGTANDTFGEVVAWGVAEDTDVSSPTRVDGPFGRAVEIIESPTFVNAQAAMFGAREHLAKRLMRRTEVELEAINDFRVEPGDPCEVIFKNGQSLFRVVSSVTIPLQPSASMSLTLVDPQAVVSDGSVPAAFTRTDIRPEPSVVIPEGPPETSFPPPTTEEVPVP
jgi:hypothetical protein